MVDARSSHTTGREVRAGPKSLLVNGTLGMEVVVALVSSLVRSDERLQYRLFGEGLVLEELIWRYLSVLYYYLALET